MVRGGLIFLILPHRNPAKQLPPTPAVLLPKVPLLSAASQRPSRRSTNRPIYSDDHFVLHAPTRICNKNPVFSVNSEHMRHTSSITEGCVWFPASEDQLYRGRRYIWRNSLTVPPCLYVPEWHQRPSAVAPPPGARESPPLSKACILDC